jgi:hypothetical protein
MKRFVLTLCLSLLANPAAAFVLDTVASPITAAYSVRQLKTTATRSMRFVCGDTMQFDAGFVSNVVDLTVCTGHSGISSIAKIYDQSGGTNDLSFSSGTATTCTITASGINSLPSINFTAACLYETSNVTQTANYTVNGVVQASGTTQPQMIFSADKVGTLREAHWLRYDGGPPANQYTLITFNTTGTNFNAFTSTTVTAAHTLSGILNGTAISTWVDTVAGGTATLTGSGAVSPPSIPLDLGGDNTNSSSFLGLWSETILLGAANTSDRSAIETDERTTFFPAAGGAPSRTLMGVGK